MNGTITLSDSDAPASVNVTAYDKPTAVISALILGMLGSLVFMSMPILIGFFADHLGFNEQQTGWLLLLG